jgi:hypothetical protein
MDQEDLGEIIARADEARELLRYSSSMKLLIENDIPVLVAEIERLKDELIQAGKCPHGSAYEDRRCVHCFGDGTEEVQECGTCGTQSWHRAGKCLDHDKSAPKPFELMKSELEKLRSKAQEVQEEWSAQITTAEEHLRESQASRAIMREALEYIRPRIGSTNVGESLAKIDRALSASVRNV